MPPYDGRVSGRAVCPLRRRVASSEAEIFCPLEGRFATLKRGGDAGRSRGSRWEPSSEAEIAPRVRGGCEWAACWASLSLFLSSRLEGGRRPSWAQLPNMCLRFLGDFSTPIRVPLIVAPDNPDKQDRYK